MRVRNKEHQSLSKEQLKELCYDFPNDQQLGEEIRRMASATTNNPQGERATSGINSFWHDSYGEIKHFKAVYNPRQYTLFEDTNEV